MIKAIAVDDEPLALELIENFCRQSNSVRLEKAFTKSKEALNFIRENPIDLLFLDINMPSISGIEFYKTIQQKPMLIFTTSYSEYAFESYELDAVDFLLKPFSFSRFSRAISKAEEYSHYLARQNKSLEQLLFVYTDYSLLKIELAAILYIEAMDDYVKIHLSGQKPVMTRSTMKAIMEKLPSTDFFRVHKSYIVPFRRVQMVRNKTITIEKKQIPLGVSYEKGFLKLFKR
ncbi:MAG TPA: LytTR family DNA-binding domain-containing protein [Puia sp.]|nr:LytTR family DNA-binding domain-containing protein [Puia sp.]